MESKTDPNEAAFARTETEISYGQVGLTKREWFAGQALAGILAHAGGYLGRGQHSSAVGHAAALHADSVIHALNAEKGPAPAELAELLKEISIEEKEDGWWLMLPNAGFNLGRLSGSITRTPVMDWMIRRAGILKRLQEVQS